MKGLPPSSPHPPSRVISPHQDGTNYELALQHLSPSTFELHNIKPLTGAIFQILGHNIININILSLSASTNYVGIAA